MSDLKAFLKQNAIKEENIHFAASKSFVDENGKPMEWEIRAITSAEDEEIRHQCTHRVPINGRKGAKAQELDSTTYIGKLAVACTVYPNLHAQELQDSYGVMGADVLLKRMLKPGEYAEYLAKVQEICGFDLSMDELVEEAKN